MGKKTTIWTTLGKIGAYAGAPFTGGASMAAIPVLDAVKARADQKDAQKFSTGSTANPGSVPGSVDYTNPKSALSYFGNTNQSRINDLRSGINSQTTGLTNRFNTAADSASKDYGNLQGSYQSFMNSNPISYTPYNQNFEAYGGYENFANTGGYSPEDVSNIRARANAPIRATYANAQDSLRRSNVLAGGNLANAAASKAKMTRELGYNLGDQSLNTEATLAEAIRNGKLAGLGGMTGIDTSRMQEGLSNAGQNLNAQGLESNRLLNALQGQTSLYGATPGQASLYGNQMLNSSGQGVQVEGLQNQLMQAILSGALGNSALPSGYQKGLGNTASTLQLIGQLASLYGQYKGGSSGGFGGVSGNPGLPGGTSGSF